MMVDTTMPMRIAAPGRGGTAGFDRSPAMAVAATLPLFMLLYFFYTIFLEHYAITVIPAIILLCLLGIGHWPAPWPRFSREISSGLMA